LSAVVREIESDRESIALQGISTYQGKKLGGMLLYRVDDLEIMAKRKPGTKKQHASRYD